MTAIDPPLRFSIHTGTATRHRRMDNANTFPAHIMPFEPLRVEWRVAEKSRGDKKLSSVRSPLVSAKYALRSVAVLSVEVVGM